METEISSITRGQLPWTNPVDNPSPADKTVVDNIYI